MSGKIRDIEINDYSITRLCRSNVSLQKVAKKSLAITLSKKFYESAEFSEIRSCTFFRVRQ
jgi:hypothetical protein